MSTLTSELSTRGAGSALLESLTAIWRAYRKSGTRRVAIRSLESLDDYMLKDMGITRSEIRSVVQGPQGERRLRHDDIRG